jgi:metal-responsive CopG/Arc/MetJ family transcriptional regulator
MKNIQISFEEELLEQIDRLILKSNLSRDDIFREAVRRWLKETEIKSFET